LFYREFWKAHNLEHLAGLIPVPEASVDGGHVLHIPFLIRNDTPAAAQIRLTAVLPPAWKEKTRCAVYDVPPGRDHPVEVELLAPPSDEPRWHEIVFKTESGGAPAGSVMMHVAVGKTGGLPQ